jgi:mono/diheme cytochrome c family protein
MAIQRSRGGQRLVLTALLAAALYWGCGGDSGPPTSGAPMSAEEVKKLYGVKCGICHGTDGSMQYAGSKDLSVSTLSLDEVKLQIANGKGTMPPMKNVLDQAAIDRLAEYVMTLRK